MPDLVEIAKALGGDSIDAEDLERWAAEARDAAQNDPLAWFGLLSGTLHLTLSEAPKPMTPHVLNEIAPPDAAIEAISMTWEVYEDETFRPLTEEEWSRLVLPEPRIEIVTLSEDRLTFEAPSPEGFSTRTLAEIVEESERQTRVRTEWFGGIDAHHVFFEGLTKAADGAYQSAWGS